MKEAEPDCTADATTDGGAARGCGGKDGEPTATSAAMGSVIGSLLGNAEATTDDDCEDGSVDSPLAGSSPRVAIGAAEAAARVTEGSELRAGGNDDFKAGAFEDAVRQYTAAIGRCSGVEVETDGSCATTNGAETAADEELKKTVELCLVNRAFCHIKMENYGLAIMDAERALAVNPQNAKAHYRRGCAYLCLMKYQPALKDFLSVRKLKKGLDPDTESRVKECQKQIRHDRFSAAICSERTRPASESVDPSGMAVAAEYTGPTFEDATAIPPSFLSELLEYIKVPGNKLHRKYAYQLVLQLIKILRKLPNCVEVELAATEGLTICGDTHGQFYDLLNIFEINGLPSATNAYLFNGDFVDRGSFSAEVILTLFAAKAIFPQHVHLARGNHETSNLNRLYGFMGEVKAKYDEALYNLFCESFCLLPLAHTVNSKIFVVHGGLFSQDGVTLADIQKINRNREPPEDGLMVDMLWSDPKPTKGRIPSKRGVSCNFGPDVTARFVKENDFDYVVRSHEMKNEGYEVEHGGKMVTIFSAPNYCDQMGNKGAFIKVTGSCLRPKFTSFAAVPHPSVPSMKFAHPMLNF